MRRSQFVPALALVTGRALHPDPTPAARLQQATDLEAVTAAIAALSGVLARLARDLRLLAAGPLGGPAELRMPALVEGSTFFAGKTNPVGAETVLQLDLVVRGHAATVQGAVAATATAARRLHDGCLDGLTVDDARCAELAAGAAAQRPEPTPSVPATPAASQPEDRP